jgi:hypothetical protein
MTRRITLLIALALALAVPAAASAQSSDSAARAQERYYSSYGEPASTPADAQSAATPDAGSWKALAIGGGALVLVLGAAELVTLGRLRRATAT